MSSELAVDVAPTDDVHLGVENYHQDRAGLPACSQLVWQLDGDTDVISRAEAERVGYQPCWRCCGGER